MMRSWKDRVRILKRIAEFEGQAVLIAIGPEETAGVLDVEEGELGADLDGVGEVVGSFEIVELVLVLEVVVVIVLQVQGLVEEVLGEGDVEGGAVRVLLDQARGVVEEVAVGEFQMDLVLVVGVVFQAQGGIQEVVG